MRFRHKIDANVQQMMTDDEYVFTYVAMATSHKWLGGQGKVRFYHLAGVLGVVRRLRERVQAQEQRQVTVQKLCLRGVFPGAERYGRVWAIPECDLTPQIRARYRGGARPKGGRPRGSSKTGNAAQAARAVLAAPGAASLSERDWEMLCLRADGWTLDEIGAEFGITRERVRQIEARAVQDARLSRGGRPRSTPDSDVGEGVVDAPEDDEITGDAILTVSDVRRALGGISGELVRKLLRAGEFPHAFKRGADWFVPKSDITPDLRARFAGGVRRGRRPTRWLRASLAGQRAPEHI